MQEFIQTFQEFRKILCVCPCCGNLVRVSDLKLKLKGAVSTWLDIHERNQQKLEDEMELFESKAGKLREKAIEKGRKRATKAFNNAILPDFRNLKLDPFDIKPIFNPVDFLVFNGMNKRTAINSIIFLSKKSGNHALNQLRKNVENVVYEERYEWQSARIDESGHIKFE